ncbi:MAG: alpha/beta hydrolase [Leptospiraceae bacterium]|nr:alpha/beta hydrolase [Leptospiraceae bacterium]
MATHEVRAGKLRFSYEKYGTGREVFVLIHGWCSVRNFWGPVLKDFIELGTCYNMDLIGHHPATRGEDIHDLDLVKVTSAQAAAIREMVGKGKITLVGHSTGGLIALNMALQHPDLVKRVIAIGPVIHGPIKGPLGFAKDLYKLNLHAALHLPFAFIRSLPDAFRNIFETGVHDAKAFFKRSDAQSYVTAYREQMLNIPPEVMGAWLGIIDKADLRPVLSGSRIRALFITGSHDRVVTHTHAREIARKMPNAAYHEYSHSGHIPILEEERECFENMHLWLDEHK